MKDWFLLHTGTHDVKNISLQNDGGVRIKTEYSEQSNASGALFTFIFITESGDVDFNRSYLVALDRDTSLNYTLPFDLYPGYYRVYVYDIECDGMLANGVGYPAVNRLLNTSSQDSQGKLDISLHSGTPAQLYSILRFQK